MYANLKLRIRRLGSGDYIVNDRYFVARHGLAHEWRWWDGNNQSVGGEWRATKREAIADLQEHVDAPRKAARPDWNWK